MYKRLSQLNIKKIRGKKGIKMVKEFEQTFREWKETNGKVHHEKFVYIISH